MNHTLEVIGILSVAVIWGGLGLILLLPRIKRQFAALTQYTQRAPFRSALGAIAVGIAIVYGANKPTSVVFEYEVKDDKVTLKTAKSAPANGRLVIPAEYEGKTVVALSDNFCAEEGVASSISTVVIPASVMQIGKNFFGYDGTSSKYTVTAEVNVLNQNFAVTGDGVLYACSDGKVYYALPGKVNTVRFKVTYAPGTNGVGETRHVYKDFGQELKVEEALFGREGYLQSGWTKSGESGAHYEFGDGYTNNADLKLEPEWSNDPNPYEDKWWIRFDAMGGSGTYGPFDFEGKNPDGSTRWCDLPKCDLEKEGYKLVGWVKIKNRKYAPAENDHLSLTTNSPVGPSAAGELAVYYAVWLKADSYGIAFNPNLGGSEGAWPYDAWSMDYLSVVTGQVAKLPPCTLRHPENKTFAGWEYNGRRYDDEVMVFNLTNRVGKVLEFNALWND